MDEEHTARIRALNDRLRITGIGGSVMVTAGIAGRGEAFMAAAMRALHAYDTFNADNDPRQEHDFGAMEVEGAKLFWKIDYYAPGLNGGSEDPSEAANTYRVLTLMLVSEY